MAYQLAAQFCPLDFEAAGVVFKKANSVFRIQEREHPARVYPYLVMRISGRQLGNFGGCVQYAGMILGFMACTTG